MVSCDAITSVCLNMINLDHQGVFTSVAPAEIWKCVTPVGVLVPTRVPRGLL